MANTNLSIRDSIDIECFNGTTDSNGEIPAQWLILYNQTPAGKTYHSPYTIYVNDTPVCKFEPSKPLSLVINADEPADAFISNLNISFSDDTPAPTQTIQINATVFNAGTATLSNAVAGFYDGDTLIGQQTLSIGAGESANASVNWTIPSGNAVHEIRVNVSGAAEACLENNEANTTIAAYYGYISETTELASLTSDYFGLESNKTAIDSMAAVLSNHSDYLGIKPEITAYVIVGNNTNFTKTAQFGNSTYYYDPISSELVSNYLSKKEDGVFYFEYGGEAKFNYDAWLDALRAGDPAALSAFANNSVATTGNYTANSQYSILSQYLNYDSLSSSGAKTFDTQNATVAAGILEFYRLFSYYPRVATPYVGSGYYWDANSEAAWLANGIPYVSYAASGSMPYYPTPGLEKANGLLGVYRQISYGMNLNSTLISMYGVYNDSYYPITIMFDKSYYESANAATATADLNEILTRLDALNVTYVTTYEMGQLYRNGYSILNKTSRSTIVRNYRFDNVTIAFEHPAAWSSVRIKDLTTGQVTLWNVSAINFTAEAGHVYEVYDNAPPSIVDAAPVAQSAYRVQDVKVYLNATDDFDSEEELSVSVEYKPPSGNWTAVSAAYSGGVWQASINVTASFAVGPYSIRYNVTDGRGETTNWTYANNSLMVQNNLPVNLDFSASASGINRTGRIWLFTNTSDVETLAEYMQCRMQYKAPGDSAWTEMTEYWNSSRWESTITFTSDVPAGAWLFKSQMKDADDGYGNATQITVDVYNNAPRIQPAIPDPPAAQEDAVISINLSAFKTDVETSASGLSWAVDDYDSTAISIISISADLVNITPENDFYGASYLVIALYDPDGGTVNQTINLTWNSVNDAPSISSSIAGLPRADEDTNISADLTEYESDAWGESSGATLNWYVSWYNQSAIASITGMNSTTDLITFVPAGNWFGTTNVTLVLWDENGTTDSRDINLTWNSTNDTPYISPAVLSQTACEDSNITLNLTQYENDAWGEDSGAALTWYVMEYNSSCIKFVVGNGSSDDRIMFAPLENWFGATSALLMLEDSNHSKAYQNVSLNWTSVNDLPSAGSIAISKNASTRGGSVVVSVNGSDIEDAISAMSCIIQYKEPSGGWSAAACQYSSSSGVWEANITLAASFELGNYSFRACLLDTDGNATDWMYSNLSVLVENSPPSAIDVRFSSASVLREDDLIITANASDFEDDEWLLGASVQYRAPNGTWKDMLAAFVTNSWVATFSPASSAKLGSYGFRARFTDRNGSSSDWLEALTAIEVLNNPPEINPSVPSPIYANRGNPIQIDLTDYENDIEDSDTKLDWSVSAYNTSAILAVSGESGDADVLTFTPVPRYSGAAEAVLVLTDADGGQCSQAINLTWNMTNTPPQIASFSTMAQIVPRGQTEWIIVNASDTEDDEANLTCEIEIKPSASASWLQFAPSYNSTTGLWCTGYITTTGTQAGDYDARVRLTDADNATPGWSYYNRSFSISNNMPAISGMNVSPNLVLRGGAVLINISAGDVETAVQQLNLSIYYKAASGDWCAASATFSGGVWTSNLSFPLNCTAGNYSIKASCSDADNATTGWLYLNDSFVVLNNAPIILSVAVSNSTVYRGGELALTANGSDAEDQSALLGYEMQIRPHNGTWRYVACQFVSNSWRASICPSASDAIGDYDARARLTDPDDSNSGWFELPYAFLVKNRLPSINPCVPDPPAAAAGQDVSIDLTAYECDAEDTGANLTWICVNYNQSAIANISGQGSYDDALRFTPASGYVGATAITLLLSDKDGGNASQIINITWFGSQQAPRLNSISALSSTAERGRNSTIYVYGANIYAQSNLTAQYMGPSGSGWSNISATTRLNNTTFCAHFTPPRDCAIGTYSIRVRIDAYNFTTDWLYLNDTIVVCNSIPSCPNNHSFSIDGGRASLRWQNGFDAEGNVTTRLIASIAAGAASTVVLNESSIDGCNFTLPTLSPGTYNITLRSVDADGGASEPFCFEIVIPAPVFSLSRSSVEFSSASPAPGETIMISMSLENAGTLPAETTVNFYDGNPSLSASRLIGSASVTIAQNSSSSVSIPWLVTRGQHDIWVVVGNDTGAASSGSSNNSMRASITASALIDEQAGSTAGNMMMFALAVIGIIAAVACLAVYVSKKNSARGAPKAMSRGGAGGAKPSIIKEAGDYGAERELPICGVCFGSVKPQSPLAVCVCGTTYHRICAQRVGECPNCGNAVGGVGGSRPPQT